jgi:hypothetical protein
VSGPLQRAASGLIIHELPSGESVVATADGALAVVLNPTGRSVLELVDGRRSPAQIAALLAEIYPEVPPGDLQRDVAKVVGELLEKGILAPCGDLPSTV